MKIIDINDLPRKEQFNYFTGNVMYGITTKLDITNVYHFAKKNKISVYYCLGYVIYTAMKEIDEYNIRYLDEKLVLGTANTLSFCSLNDGESVMKFVSVDYCDDIIKFCKNATKENKKQKTLKGTKKYNLSDYACFITCIPWFQFSCLTNPTPQDEYDFIPRLAWDKFEIINGKVTTNFSLEVNHKLIDGYLIAKLLDNINKKFEIYK